MNKLDNIPEKPSVDWLLSNVDLKFEGYVPSTVAFEFFSFIRLALGEEPENANPLAHYFLIDVIFQQPNVSYYFEQRGINYEELKGSTAIMCCREFSKSTLIGTYLPLFIAWKGEIPGYGKVNYGLYIGDSMRNNVKTTMNTIELVFLESEWLIDQFESYRFTDEVMELVRHPRTPKEISVQKRALDQGKKKEQVPGRSKRKFAMKGVGAQTGTRGTRSGLDRPQFAIFDDLVASETDANSEIVLSSIESTIDSDVLEALHGAGSFSMIIGTPYNKKDPVYKRIESGAWVPVVFPICKEINADMKKEDFEGVWEDRHSFDRVKKRYNKAVKQDKVRSFNQELMLRISSDEDRLIPDSYITWFNRGDIMKRASEYSWYVTTDYTTTGDKGSDFSGIAVWAVSSNNDWLMMDLVLAKMDLVKQYRETFRLVRKYNQYTGNIQVGIETDGQQRAHIHAIKQMMVAENEYFAIAKQKGGSQEGIRSANTPGSKHDRFKATVPFFQNGKIWFPSDLKETSDMQEMLTELQYVTYMGFGSAHDDGCDLITQMTMMDIYAPTKMMKGEDMQHHPIWYDEEDDDESSGMSSYVV